MINQAQIAFSRLNSQQLINTNFTTPLEIVAWMGAMQSQDFPMAKWAIGARLPGSTNTAIEEAIKKGSILRTHLLRPTWHFVAAEDIYWMLDLTAQHIKAAQSYRERDLELTEAVFSKCNAIIEKSLRGGFHLTRDELIRELNKAKIATDQNRASHIFMRAELEKIVCSGPIHIGKPTYALLSERVQLKKTLAREESLFTLAQRYFTSHCPATLKDFAWWSGLNTGDVRQAVELVRQDFMTEKYMDQTYWVPNDFSPHHQTETVVHILPTYDELTLSYKDRSASIPKELEQHMKEISNRGVFRPVLIIDGQVAGIWNQKSHKDTLNIEIRLFTQTTQGKQEFIGQAIRRYETFINRSVVIQSISKSHPDDELI